MNTDLSIIIISHGHEEMIRKCIASLEPGLSGLNVEILLVDNLNASQLEKEIADISLPIRLINNETPVGFSSNVNRAFEESTGRIVMLLNPDTYFQSGHFRHAIEYLDQNPKAGILGCKLIYPDGTLQQNYRRWPTLIVALGRGLYINHWPWKPRAYRDRVMEGIIFDSPHPVDWMTGACLIFRRDDFVRVGRMDSKFYLYYEDVDICYRFKEHGLSTIYFPDIQIVHSLQRSSAARPGGKTWRWHGQSMWRYFTKHRYAFRPGIER